MLFLFCGGIGMDFLARLDLLSKEKGISNRFQLAEKSGVPYTTIDNFYRNGYENVKLSTLRKLARFFGCTLDFLIFGTEEQKEEDGREELSTHELELIKKYRALGAKDQKSIDGILTSLTEKPTALSDKQ
jgi:transcriptional regulator with XRE-family HTH domain